MSSLLERQLRASIAETLEDADTPIPYLLTPKGHGLTPVPYAATLRVMCSCGKWIHWSDAPLVGHMLDDEEHIELRNCKACGSTRALVIARKL